MQQVNILLLAGLGIFALWLAATNKVGNVPKAWSVLMTGS